MILRLFRRKSKANEAICLRAYEAIVAAARQKTFYAHFLVPDTPLGRYEMLSLHIFLVLHRMKGRGPSLQALAQDIADEFFKDVDHSLRELGIGDQGVPKRMKKLARMFYGRVQAYERALDSADRDGLAEALTRNIRPDLAFWPYAAYLADYMCRCRDRLNEIDDMALAAGEIEFYDAARIVSASDPAEQEAEGEKIND